MSYGEKKRNKDLIGEKVSGEEQESGKKQVNEEDKMWQETGKL